jgi:hypothetical protein
MMDFLVISQTSFRIESFWTVRTLYGKTSFVNFLMVFEIFFKCELARTEYTFKVFQVGMLLNVSVQLVKRREEIINLLPSRMVRKYLYNTTQWFFTFGTFYHAFVIIVIVGIFFEERFFIALYGLLSVLWKGKKIVFKPRYGIISLFIPICSLTCASINPFRL